MADQEYQDGKEKAVFDAGGSVKAFRRVRREVRRVRIAANDALIRITYLQEVAKRSDAYELVRESNQALNSARAAMESAEMLEYDLSLCGFADPPPDGALQTYQTCLLYTSPSPRD